MKLHELVDCRDGTRGWPDDVDYWPRHDHNDYDDKPLGKVVLVEDVGGLAVYMRQLPDGTLVEL